MSNTNSKRIWNPEGGYTFREDSLDDVLDELDQRTSCKEAYEVITRTGLVITKIEVFKDAGHTQLTMERQITYVAGKITQFLDIYYNADGSEDSRVTQNLTRDVDDNVTECASPFTTTEPVGC